MYPTTHPGIGKNFFGTRRVITPLVSAKHNAGLITFYARYGRALELKKQKP